MKQTKCDRCNIINLNNEKSDLMLTVTIEGVDPNTSKLISKDFDLCAFCYDDFRSFMEASPRRVVGGNS